MVGVNMTKLLITLGIIMSIVFCIIKTVNIFIVAYFSTIPFSLKSFSSNFTVSTTNLSIRLGEINS